MKRRERIHNQPIFKLVQILCYDISILNSLFYNFFCFPSIFGKIDIDPMIGRSNCNRNLASVTINSNRCSVLHYHYNNDFNQKIPIHNQLNYIPDTIIQRNVIFRKKESNVNNNNYLNDKTDLDNIIIIGSSGIKIRIIICTKISISRFNTLLCYCVNSIFYCYFYLQFIFIFILLDILNPCPIAFKIFIQLIFPSTKYFENNCIQNKYNS